MATREVTRIYQFITDTHASFHLRWKENLLNHQIISKYYEHDWSTLELIMLFLAYILIAKQKFHRNSNDTNEHVITWQKVRWPWRADVSSSISFHFPQCFRAVFSEVWNSFQNSRQFSEVSNNLRKPRIALRSLKRFLKVSYSFWFLRTFREYWTISISELHISDKSFNYDSSNIMKLEVVISIVLWLQVNSISNW